MGKQLSKTVEDKSAPAPRFSGVFSIYDTPDEGIHIAWLPNGADATETQHIEIPGVIAAILRRVSNGEQVNPAEILKSVMSMGVPG